MYYLQEIGIDLQGVTEGLVTFRFCRIRSLFAKNSPKPRKIKVSRRKNDNFSKFSAPSALKIGHFSIFVTSLFGGGHPLQIDPC